MLFAKCHKNKQSRRYYPLNEILATLKKNVILLKGQGSPVSPQTILKGAVKPLILFHMVGLLREMADSLIVIHSHWKVSFRPNF